MITESVEVKTYKEKLFCNKCMAEVKSTGKVKQSTPLMYEHKCTVCGGKPIYSDKKHPRIYYMEVGEDE